MYTLKKGKPIRAPKRCTSWGRLLTRPGCGLWEEKERSSEEQYKLFWWRPENTWICVYMCLYGFFLGVFFVISESKRKKVINQTVNQAPFLKKLISRTFMEQLTSACPLFSFSYLRVFGVVLFFSVVFFLVFLPSFMLTEFQFSVQKRSREKRKKKK